MKIIKPSATIIEDELAALSIYQRIDACSAICYQRPPKPTEEEAQEFCRKMLSVKHMSTLEMAVIHLWIDSREYMDVPDSKYIITTYIGRGGVIVSGSIRAFMEADLSTEVRSLLATYYPLFFGSRVNCGPAYIAGCEPLRLAEPEEIPWQHKYVAARFIVNRSVSHELVRHRPCTFLQESQRYCRYEDEVVFIRPTWMDEGNANFDGLFEYSSAVAEGHYRTFLRRGLKPQQARAVLPNSTKTELICYASLPQWKHMFDLRCSPAADPEMRRVMIPLREEFKEKYKEVGW